MTEIISYIPNNNYLQDLLGFLKNKYSNHKNFDFFINNFIVSYNFCLNNDNIIFRPIAVYRDGILISHVALIIDKRLDKKEAFFGFMEIENNKESFDIIWDELIKKAKEEGVSLLKGPVNGSIWHQYRCIKETDESDTFKNELICEKYYYDFLISKKPDKEYGYHSGYRSNVDIILKILNSVQYNIPSNFSVRVLDTVNSLELREIAQISKKVFHTSWGYTELNESEFLSLYSLDVLNKNINKLYVLYNKEQIIGFLSTMKDEDALICKTVCILPEFQGLGLGNVLAYYVHRDAKAAGIKKIIYALIRDENNIKNFPRDDVVFFRKYSAFDFNLN